MDSTEKLVTFAKAAANAGIKACWALKRLTADKDRIAHLENIEFHFNGALNGLKELKTT